MKLVTAIIQHGKLDQVREALMEAKITRISVSRIAGRGAQSGEDLYRGQTVPKELVPKIRIEIACNDEFVDTICDTIVKSARRGNGEVGDGKIFITELQECIRIRTGERGGEAI